MSPQRKPDTLTVEHLWQCERIGAPVVSPDGRWIVVEQTTYSMEDNDSQTQLWLYATDGKTRRQFTQGGRKNTAPQWSPDGRSIAFVSRRGEGQRADESSQIYLLAVDGGEARRLTRLSTGIETFRWSPDGKSLIAISWVWPELEDDKAQAARLKERKEGKVQAKVIEQESYRYWDHWICDGRRPQLFSIDARSGKAKNLFAGHPDWSLGLGEPGRASFAIAPDGRELTWVQAEEPTQLSSPDRLMHLDLRTGRHKSRTLGAYWLSAPQYAPDGKALVVLATPASAPSQHTRLMLLPRQGEARRLAATWPRSVGTYGASELQFTPDGRALLFTAEDAGRQHLYRLALDEELPQIVIEGGHVQGFSQSGDGRELAYTLASLEHPARLFGLRLGRDAEPRRLDRCNRFLDKIKLARCESRSFRGAEGETIQAFIAYPPGFDPRRRYPLLHNIHGGPHAAHLDTWHYRWNMQLFAAEGYVVAAVNYHGSSGFDEAFLGSIDGDLGRREFADIEAVTDALIAEKIVDPKRLYAAGGSYGGHMVAWMNGHTDRYRAYVCHAGVYNWVSQFGGDIYRWLEKELGCWPWDDPARYQAQSPHSYAANFKTPTLVIHGELDYRVPYYQGLEYHNILRAKGVPTRLVVFPDENHWVLKPQNSRLWYQEFFAWLRRF